MTSSVMLALGAALTGFGGRLDHRAPVELIAEECPVCDYPFGNAAHMCLASAGALGIAS